MRQLIIARKDLHMSPGKLAAQVSHASMAFLTSAVRNAAVPDGDGYSAVLTFDKDLYEKWIGGIFTKTVCEAKNRNHLMKAISAAEAAGLRQGVDFFLIKDACLTELEPEELDENGVGRTLTCIGFRPLDDDLAHLISKKYQLYR